MGFHTAARYRYNAGVADALPRLRFNLDFMPLARSREAWFVHPRSISLFGRGPLLVPPVLVNALECFDGMQSALDLRSELVRLTGEIQVGEIEKNLFDALNEAGFLENDRYRELKAGREAAFAKEPLREAIFAGSAYPEDVPSLSELLVNRLGGPAGASSTVAIAAPHASPDGAWDTYRMAYQSLPPVEQAQDRTFVILGTSHYGAPERFGLTRKSFQTPFGQNSD